MHQNAAVKAAASSSARYLALKKHKVAKKQLVNIISTTST
jgi:hypothetical protein